MRITIKDIARQAEVSKSLVSMYLNRDPRARLSDATRRRIDAIVAEHDYQQSPLARGLSTGRSKTLGLVAGTMTNPYQAHFADAVLRAAEARGYQLLVSLSDWDRHKEERALKTLMDRQVDGAIYLPRMAADSAIGQALSRLRFPLMLASEDDSPPFPFARIRRRIESAVREAVRCFRAHGHRRVTGAFHRVGPWVDTFARICGEEGVVHDPFPVMDTEDTVATTARELFRDPPKALFAGNCHLVSELLLLELREGREIPTRFVTVMTFPGDYIASPRLLGAVHGPFYPVVGGMMDRLVAALATGDPPEDVEAEYFFHSRAELEVHRDRLLSEWGDKGCLYRSEAAAPPTRETAT